MVGEQKPHGYRASLVVTSETLSLAELTAGLGIPSRGSDRGDPVSRRVPAVRRREHACWILESEGGRSRSLEALIEDLVAFAGAHHEVLHALAPRLDMRILCGVFSGVDAQGGFALEQGVLRRLVDLDLDLPLVFDLY